MRNALKLEPSIKVKSRNEHDRNLDEIVILIIFFKADHLMRVMLFGLKCQYFARVSSDKDASAIHADDPTILEFAPWFLSVL